MRSTSSSFAGMHFFCVWNFAWRVHITIRRQMKCETYGIFKSFFNLRVLYCTQNLFKYFKLDQNTPSIFRVLQASGIMIVFKHFFVQRFSIKVCSWKSNRFLFYCLGVTPKNWPTVKKDVRKKKNDTKTYITQVLIELKQKCFGQ